LRERGSTNLFPLMARTDAWYYHPSTWHHKKIQMRVITFGTFDVFHIGHFQIMERAREYRDIRRIEYLPRTPSISTTVVIEKIKIK